MTTRLKVLATLVLLFARSLVPAAQPKGERVTVKGEVVDMWCHLEGGDRGAAKKQCATAAQKPAILSEFSTPLAISMSLRA